MPASTGSSTSRCARVDRRARHAGDQVQGRAVPVRAVRRRRLPRRGARLLAVERRRDREPRAADRCGASPFPACRDSRRTTSGDDAPQEARAIGATVGGVRVWSLYVPNGRALGDPHYYYKLDWLARAAAVHAPTRWPATPTSRSRWSATSTSPRRMPTTATPPSSRASRPTCRQPEREAFAALESAGLTDVVRPLVPTGFTYWDYKRLRFPKNEGMRIDFILGSHAFAERRRRRDDPPQRAQGRGSRATTCPSSSTSTSTSPEEEDDDRPMIFG